MGLAGPGWPAFLCTIGSSLDLLKSPPSRRVFCSGLAFVLLGAGPWVAPNPGMTRPLTFEASPPGPRLPFSPVFPDGADAMASPPPDLVLFREADLSNADFPFGDPPSHSVVAGPVGEPSALAVPRKSARLDKGARICSLAKAKARKALLIEGSTSAPATASSVRSVSLRPPPSGTCAPIPCMIKTKGALCGVILNDDDVRDFRAFLEASTLVATRLRYQSGGLLSLFDVSSSQLEC